jgi:hypothetical protein
MCPGRRWWLQCCKPPDDELRQMTARAVRRKRISRLTARTRPSVSKAALHAGATLLFGSAWFDPNIRSAPTTSCAGDDGGAAMHLKRPTAALRACASGLPSHYGKRKTHEYPQDLAAGSAGLIAISLAACSPSARRLPKAPGRNLHRRSSHCNRSVAYDTERPSDIALNADGDPISGQSLRPAACRSRRRRT